MTGLLGNTFSMERLVTAACDSLGHKSGKRQGNCAVVHLDQDIDNCQAFEESRTFGTSKPATELSTREMCLLLRVPA